MLEGKSLRRGFEFAISVILLFGVCFACYRHPILDYFDRFIYEAIVLGKSKPIEVVYEIVKHENQRAESSDVLDSPQHLRELEPLYAIRPLYIGTVSLFNFFMPLRQAIDFVSAVSFFGIGIVAILWTRRPLLAALLMSAYPLLVLARIGGPAALSALFVIAGLWLVQQWRMQAVGLLILFTSVAVRTDNVLLLLVVLAWHSWEKRLGYLATAALALLSVAFVSAINRWAGNYGWLALFQYSFLCPGSPDAPTPFLRMVIATALVIVGIWEGFSSF